LREPLWTTKELSIAIAIFDIFGGLSSTFLIMN